MFYQTKTKQITRIKQNHVEDSRDAPRAQNSNLNITDLSEFSAHQIFFHFLDRSRKT